MRVVCINNGSIKDRASVVYLTLYKVYDVLYISKQFDTYIIEDDRGERKDIFKGRFIKMSEYRKLKLDKLNSEK